MLLMSWEQAQKHWSENLQEKKHTPLYHKSVFNADSQQKKQRFAKFPFLSSIYFCLCCCSITFSFRVKRSCMPNLKKNGRRVPVHRQFKVGHILPQITHSTKCKLHASSHPARANHLCLPKCRILLSILVILLTILSIALNVLSAANSVLGSWLEH